MMCGLHHCKALGEAVLFVSSSSIGVRSGKVMTRLLSGKVLFQISIQTSMGL